MADYIENMKEKIRQLTRAYVFSNGIMVMESYPHSMCQALEAVRELTATDRETIRDSVEYVISLRQRSAGGNTAWCTPVEWVEAVGRHMFQKPRINAQKWRYWMTSAFDVLDADKDGYINKEQFNMHYLNSNRRSDKEFLERAFASIDTAGTGRLSRQQYSDAYAAYFTDPGVPYEKLPLF